MELGEALTSYYAAHGLPADGGASASWFRVRLGRFTIPLPNPPARRRAVFFHDTNHVLAGYDTTFSRGEIEIAAFEIGAGCGRYAIAWGINLPMMLIGGVLRPAAVFRAFVRGRHAGSVYRCREARTTLERMRVDDLRTQFLLDRPPPAAALGDLAAFAMWQLITLLTIAAIITVIGGLLWWAARTAASLVSRGARIGVYSG